MPSTPYSNRIGLLSTKIRGITLHRFLLLLLFVFFVLKLFCNLTKGFRIPCKSKLQVSLADRFLQTPGCFYFNRHLTACRLFLHILTVRVGTGILAHSEAGLQLGFPLLGHSTGNLGPGSWFLIPYCLLFLGGMQAMLSSPAKDQDLLEYFCCIQVPKCPPLQQL